MESPKCSQANLVRSLSILLLLPIIGTSQATKLAPAIFSFGDSLVDAGNNNYINTLAKANSLPNGLDFPGSYATGRFTNGRTTVDITGQFAGFTEFIPPYLAPNTTGRMILNGVSYASGAGGILDSSGYILLGRLSMNKQLEYFANTRAQIFEMVGEEAGTKLLNSALYAINIGSNDYLNNYYQPFSPIGNLTSTQVVTLLISTFRGQLKRMYSMGARKIVVASLGPLGCVPFQLTFRLSKDGECSQKVDAEVVEFNAGVLSLVKELNANLPGLTIVYADAYKAVSEMISNPRAYGFSVVNVGCCGGGPVYKGLIPCFPNFKICPNRFDYFFWDPYHPTEKANVELSHRFWEGQGYTYPMTIKELILL